MTDHQDSTEEQVGMQVAAAEEGLDISVTEWVEEMSRTQRGEQSICEWLKDGKILCGIANRIQANVIPKVNKKGMPFKEMENISAFTKACRTFGMNEKDLFSTPDLYEERNIRSVLVCLHALGTHVDKLVRGYNGPVCSHGGKVEVTEEMMTDRKSRRTVKLEKSLKNPKAEIPQKTELDFEPKKSENGSTHDNLEERVVNWLVALTGCAKSPQKSFADWLQDGQILCKAANAIRPKICPRINSSNMPFKQMENISAFIKACRELGVMDKDVFCTVDLFESKDICAVQRCIQSLGRCIKKQKPAFAGPAFDGPQI